jgi:hypothetical protein
VRSTLVARLGGRLGPAEGTMANSSAEPLSDTPDMSTQSWDGAGAGAVGGRLLSFCAVARAPLPHAARCRRRRPQTSLQQRVIFPRQRQARKEMAMMMRARPSAATEKTSASGRA